MKCLLMIKILQDKGALFVHVNLTVRDKFDILPEAIRMQDQKQNNTKTKTKTKRDCPAYSVVRVSARAIDPGVLH